MWQPSGGWQLKRILATVAPVLTFGYFGLQFAGIDLPAWAIPVAVVVLAPVSIVLAIRAFRTSRARREGMQVLAAQQGWAYWPADPRFTQRWSTAPFGQGDARSATDVVTGSFQGFPFAAFTYGYSTGSREHRRRTVLGVCTLLLPTRLPPLEVTPESLIGEIAPGVVRADVDLESETFNRRYRVRTPVPKFASDVLPPRTLELLLSVEPFSWRIEGQDLVAWGPPTADMGDVMQRLEVLATIVRNIPQFVWKDVSPPRLGRHLG